MYTDTMSQNSIPQTKETNIDGMLVGFVVFLLLFTGVVLYKYNKASVDTKIKRTLNRNAHVVILSTYGPSVQGSPFYEKYVEKAVKYILDPKNKVNELVIVGGYTVDPNTSQSQAVLNYIKEKYPEFISSNIPVTLDECGITTWQNIKNAKKLMDREGIAAKKITIFAEESRFEKIQVFAFSEFTAKTDEIKKSLSDMGLRTAEKNMLRSREEQLKALGSAQKRQLQVPNEPMNYNNIEISILTESAGLPQDYVDDERIKINQEMKEFFDEKFGKQKIKERLDSWSKTAGFNTVENLVQKGCVEYKEFLKK